MDLTQYFSYFGENLRLHVQLFISNDKDQNNFNFMHIVHKFFFAIDILLSCVQQGVIILGCICV